MKRITLVAAIGVFVATLFGALGMAQNAPLGDYARQARIQKDHQAPAAKSFDNDNLPRADKLSVVGQAPAESGDASAPATSSETAAPDGEAKTASPSWGGSRPPDAAARQTAEAENKAAQAAGGEKEEGLT